MDGAGAVVERLFQVWRLRTFPLALHCFINTHLWGDWHIPTWECAYDTLRVRLRTFTLALDCFRNTHLWGDWQN